MVIIGIKVMKQIFGFNIWKKEYLYIIDTSQTNLVSGLFLVQDRLSLKMGHIGRNYPQK